MHYGRIAKRACWLLATGYWLLALSGCATATAKSAVDLPALDVPPPPPRTLEPADTEPTPPATLPDEPARRVAPPATRRPPAAAPKSEPKEPAKTEQPATPPPDAAKPAADLKPPTTLQTASADAEGKEDQQIRALLAKASEDLTHIDYRRLSADARTQYDTAKRFVTQAKAALRAKNLVFARSVADKAAALAAQLAGK